MVTYVPGTRERDPKKMVMSLQQLGPKLDAMQAAWTSYTPVVTANTGTFTSVSATGRYLQNGKSIFISAKITITTNGTAAGFVQMTLPFTAVASCVMSGRAITLSGKMLQAIVFGTNNFLDILNYDNTYPGATGEALVISGLYESV